MPILYLDTETTGLDPFTSELVTLQLMTESGRFLIIKDPTSLQTLKPKLEESLIVGHNLKFDSKFLKHHYGITLYNVYDTYLAEVAISGGLFAGKKGVAAYKDLVLKYCGVRIDKSEQTGFKKEDKLSDAQLNYAYNDLKYLPQIMKHQKTKIKLLELENVINTEMRALPAVVWLELSGIPVDTNKLSLIKTQLELKREVAKTVINNAFSPNQVNLNSPKQLLENLHRLEIPVKNTSTKELSKYQHPIINALKDFKETEKLLNTFVDKLPGFIHPVTGRVHSSFNQYGAKSGRFTSSNPNLQQQPSKFTEWRSVFKACPGYKIISVDYSQIELRILAQVSKDKEFLKAYNTPGMDLHVLTASKIFKKPIESITEEERSIAKIVNFGIAYGMWTQGLIANLNNSGINITKIEAEKIIKNFYKAYPEASNYLRETSEQGLKNHEVHNVAGRLIRFNPPKTEEEERGIKRESKNLPIQSLCADMIKTAMGNLLTELEPLGVRFINTVHDELVFECPENITDTVTMLIEMETEAAGRQFLTDLPCKVAIIVGDYWKKK